MPDRNFFVPVFWEVFLAFEQAAGDESGSAVYPEPTHDVVGVYLPLLAIHGAHRCRKRHIDEGVPDGEQEKSH